MANGSAHSDLHDVVAAARAAWPDVACDDEAFMEFVRAEPARLVAASVTNAGDLLLAFGAARGEITAIRTIEREYFDQLGSLLPAPYRHDASEIVQILRERMLVQADGRRPRIEEYTGRGAMRNWLRVAAVRIALNLRRSTWREVAFDEERTLAERVGSDLEIDDLKRRYRAEFRAAFSAALRVLRPRDRTILRQHYLDGLTMDAIGSFRRVHRITIVRWMNKARQALAHETRRELGVRLRIDRTELESILRLIESQMDMSIRAFLEKD